MSAPAAKRLIVTADDVGLHRGMTEGAIRAHRDGIVTACSIVANGGAFDDAVARLQETPSLEVGVHLTLVEERSLTGMRNQFRRAMNIREQVDDAIGSEMAGLHHADRRPTGTECIQRRDR